MVSQSILRQALQNKLGVFYKVNARTTKDGDTKDMDTTIRHGVARSVEKLTSADRESIQDLLDQEARLANSGKRDSTERKELLMLIKLRRNENLRPWCFGYDDCSTDSLGICAWRNECGT